MITRRRICLLASTLTIELWSGGASAATGNDALKSSHFAVLVPGPATCPPLPGGGPLGRGLSDLGYDPVSAFEFRCFSELADLPRLVAELLSSKPVLFAVWGSVVAVRAARQAAPTIPIVFVDVTDPVQYGLVESLSHPGGNTTGISNIGDELQAKKVEILRDAVPHAKRVGLLCNLANPLQADYLRTIQAAAAKVKFETRTYSVHTPDDLAGAFGAMERDHVDAMVLLPDAWFFAIRQQVIELANRYRIPAIYGNSAYPKLGALLTYGADLDDMSYRAAAYVDKILRGARPADIPVELPTKFNFIINAKTARELGLSLPPAVLLRATQVIDN